MAVGRVVGAIAWRPQTGEWRTNFSLGGEGPDRAAAAAVDVSGAAAAAVQGSLVGVDIVSVSGGYALIEVNGRVDFDRLYSLPGEDAYERAAVALELPRRHHPLPAAFASARSACDCGGLN